MKKLSIVEKSQCLDISGIDPWQPVTPSTVARLLDRSPSSITRSGKIIREDDGKIVLGKNAVYISKLYSHDQLKMSAEQRKYFQMFFDKVREGASSTVTAPGKSTGPKPYLPSKLEFCSIYEIGILTDRTFLPVLKIFTGEDHEDGIQALTMQPDITLSIDRNGAIDSLFFEDKKIDQLFFREVDE
jgi:hypothetical protein